MSAPPSSPGGVSTRQPAVFLDRDGTINEQMGYINHISRFHLLPGVGQAIRRLNEYGLPVLVVTNQSGLARGYFPESLLDEVHAEMRRQLALQGAHIDGLYICPHHPEAKEERFRLTCTCRKPRTGLLEQAAAERHLDLPRSYVVGDRWSDLRCGAAVGATTILVLTGYGRGDAQYIGPTQTVQPDFVAEDLQTAVQWILDRENNKQG
ncbi:histidinol-phosphate phosphatase family protein [Desulfobulbus propionicus DSM 2032]|jgi:D-glycero-D-manno-heptose 1,7-bisphosphate phosphatase|uniref:D,D-heptose 1,7-bisphosphate phosphatase n=1 Tax=Desulfobulbus propionicus (strain ATCC 33891 / DSM 2032 / VKM B-1956 / 1pr3) TaxID=577650 RepID=A0A7U3YLT6_DESPD|nr:HAD family hydrolase [Desulfobulbus propionicus]ADW17773.1 histidinol-phosphate phosphatase family protein [Desulfobulbus propionicus DSM 2032]